MADDNDNLDDDDTSGPATVTLTRAQIRSMERDAKSAREAIAEANSLRLQLAVTQAGLDITDPKIAFFAKHYDGETTVEAVKAAAATLGFVTAAESDDEGDDGVDPNLTDARDRLASGALPDNGKAPEKPVRETAITQAREFVKNGGTQEDGMAFAFNQIVGAAAKGDKSVIIPSIGQSA